jgi:RNA polymerase-binding protein DksA
MSTRLSGKEMEQFGRLLAERERRLRAEITDMAGEAADMLSAAALPEGGDDAGRAMLQQDVQIERAEAQRDCAELQEVMAAQARIHLGSYGLCQTCGKPIGLHRLTAQPAARRCAACQSRQERVARRPVPGEA